MIIFHLIGQSIPNPGNGGDEGCIPIIYGCWALGGGEMTLPNDVGFSVGDDVKSKWTLFVVQ